jgi:3-phenylpropionate/trans-cinnamate dioxygenase ferredoxin component
MLARVCKAGDVPIGGMRAFEVGGESILVANVGGTFHAVGNICTHHEAELAEGFLDENECTVECPLHNAVFSLESGEALESPAEVPIPTFPVTVEDDVIYIEFPST